MTAFMVISNKIVYQFIIHIFGAMKNVECSIKAFKYKANYFRDFPCDPMAKTLHFPSRGGMGLIPGLGTETGQHVSSLVACGSSLVVVSRLLLLQSTGSRLHELSSNGEGA